MSATPFRAVQVSDRVFWVGAIDWSVRDFHGYLTSRGTTYNAFLVVGERVVLLDTVKRPFFAEMLSRIASVVEPSRIDTVISHHAELDHSGCLPELAAIARPDRIICSKAGVEALAAHVRLDVPVEPVAAGSTHQFGDLRFTFHDTRMLHWPESMFSYLDGDDVLFSQDGFGMHIASHERWVDQLEPSVTGYESAKYFANILLPFAGPVGKIIDKLGDTVRKARVVASDHGPLWRHGLTDLVNSYARWCARKPSAKVVIAYASMWQSTALMAKAIAEGAVEAGAQVRLLGLDTAHRSDVATEVLDAAALLVGSPNLNGQMYPTIADLMSYLKGLKPKGLAAAAFGSYGWSPAAQDQVQIALDELKVERLREPLAVKYVPRDEDLAQCRDLGRQAGERALALAG